MSGSGFLQLCKAVRARTGAQRRRHILGVARMAEKLALRNGVSTLKARVAGVLHDIAREWKPETALAYAREHGLPVSEAALRAPVLLHAPIGAAIACDEFGICDPDVLNAIAHHTVAGLGMSTLEKVVYVADSIEPSRDFPDRAALEATAFRSIDEGLLGCIQASMKYLAARRVAVARETLDLYDDMVKRYAATP